MTTDLKTEDAHWAMVEISAPGKPDDLMAIASSYDSTGRFGAQTPFSDQLDNRWMGGGWEVDATHNSIIAVTNGGKIPTTAVLTFHYNGGKDTYEIKRAIAAGDQFWLNLGDVIHGGIADDQGRTFPRDLTGGTYELAQPDDGTQPTLFEGKIIVDKTYGHLTYGCLECCTQTNPQMLADPVNMPLYGQDNMYVDAYDSCTQEETSIGDQYSTWDTNNDSIATMSSTRITGVGIGTAEPFADGYTIGPGRGPCPQERSVVGSVANVMPAINWNGNPITNTTQSAVTGQQIALTASYELPPGVTVTSQSWTVAGNTIGGYTANNSSGMTMQTNFSGQSTTFYWVTAGNPLNVTFTLHLAGGNMPTATASATFNVTGVTSANMTVQTPYGGLFSIDQLTGCSQQAGGPALVFGNVMGPVKGCSGTTTGTPGITFAPQGSQPGTGNFVLVQLINSDTSTYYKNGTASLTCSSSAGLDTQYPYPSTNLGYADAPELSLPSTYTPITRSFNATMYLLWQSATSGSIPVPLAYQTWQFSGTGTNVGVNEWTASGSGGPSGGVVLTSNYPTWAGLSTPTCN